MVVKVGKKGEMKGGYYDENVSKLKAIKEMKRASEEYEQAEVEKVEVEKALILIDQKIINCLSEIEKLTLIKQKTKKEINDVIVLF